MFFIFKSRRTLDQKNVTTQPLKKCCGSVVVDRRVKGVGWGGREGEGEGLKI